MVNKSVVSWSDHAAFLLSGLRDLFSTGYNSDLEIKCGARSFRVHKLVVNLFTDYFKGCDGLWVRVSADADHVENIIRFFYLGQVTVDYGQMEEFLLTCKRLRVKLFKGVEARGPSGVGVATVATAVGKPREEDSDQADRDPIEAEEVGLPRYELDDFQLLCRNCYKCFSDDKSLKKHTWNCTRVATFPCSSCDRRFRHRIDLQQHELSHTGEKPYKCKVQGCNKAYRLKSGLVVHVRGDHENLRYKCDQCQMEFKTITGRRLHVNTAHAVEKPFPCGTCGRRYPSEVLMSRHKKVHTPEWRTYCNAKAAARAEAARTEAARVKAAQAESGS